MIERILQTSGSNVISFPCRYEVKYRQVIDKVVEYLQDYYSKAKNISVEFRDYLNENGLSASGIKLKKVPQRKSTATLYMIGKPTSASKDYSKTGKDSRKVGKLVLKRINKSAISSTVAYHLTFEISNFSIDAQRSFNGDISRKEAEAFSRYANQKYAVPVQHTSKAFY